MNRRVLFLMLLLSVSFIELNAQKIYLDRIETDGRHQIMTKAEDFIIDGDKFSFGMKVFESSFNKVWLLLISSYHYISNSTEVLLKLGNDDIIYLPVNNVNVGEVTLPSYGVTVGSITQISQPKKVNYYSSVYELCEDDMNKIDTYGIKKVRISTGVKYRDKTYSNNLLGKYITKSRKIIQDRLDNPLKSKSLFDDF